MKIEREKFDIKKSGDFEELDMKISAKGQEMLIETLSTNLYSDPIGSIVREIASNSLDAHKEVGNLDPIEIEYIEKNRLTGQFEPSIIFRDYGPGMSPQRFRETYSNIGESTKSDSNEQIGGFGIGKMSSFAYTDSFTVRTIHDKTDYTYVISRTEDAKIKIFKLHEEITTLENRTEVIINLKDTNDKSSFEEKIKQQLGYFQNIKYMGWGASVKPLTIDYDDEDVCLSVPSQSEYVYGTQAYAHILLGGVKYPINWAMLTNNDAVDVINEPFAFKFNVGEVRTALNRESVYYTEQTKKAIVDKILKVRNRFFKDLTASLKNETNLIELCSKLQSLAGGTINQLWDKAKKVEAYKANACEWRSNSKASFDFEGVTIRPDWSCFKFFSFKKVMVDWSEKIQYDKALPASFIGNDVYYAEGDLATKKSKCIWIKGKKGADGKVVQKQSYIIIEPLKFDPSAFKTKAEADFAEERYNLVKTLLKRDCLNYDDYIVDDSVFNSGDMAKFYTAAELREQNAQIYAKGMYAYHKYGNAGNAEFGFTAYEPKVKDIPKHPAKDIIYGFSEDDTKLRNAAYIIYNNKLLMGNIYGYKGDVAKLFPTAEVLILKINKQNEKHFKGKHKGAKHVNDWIMKGTEELIKFYTGFKISEVLETYKYLNYFNNFNLHIYNKYKSLQQYKEKYMGYGVDHSSAFVKNVLMYCEENGVWDPKILRILAEVQEYCDGLTILKYVEPGKVYEALDAEDIMVIDDILTIKAKQTTYKNGKRPLSVYEVACRKGRLAVQMEYDALYKGKHAITKPFYIWAKDTYCHKVEAWIKEIPLIKLNLMKKADPKPKPSTLPDFGGDDKVEVDTKDKVEI